jgi:hypothetical protein
VKHIAYPLTLADYSAQALLNNCRDTQGQISFTTEAPLEVYQDFAQHGSIMLSGYVGDTVMGKKAHLHSPVDQCTIVLDDLVVAPADPLAAALPSQVVEHSFY